MKEYLRIEDKKMYNMSKEFVKVIQSQMSKQIGYIELNDYVSAYNMPKTQLRFILEKEGLLVKLDNYNNEYSRWS